MACKVTRIDQNSTLKMTLHAISRIPRSAAQKILSNRSNISMAGDFFLIGTASSIYKKIYKFVFAHGPLPTHCILNINSLQTELWQLLDTHLG